MPLVNPGKKLEIPTGYSSITINNQSTTKVGSCNIFFDSGSQNVQLSEGGSKTVALHQNAATLENTGKTVLDVTFNP